MTSLEVDFAGVKLRNPFILASGGTGWDGEHLKRAALAGAGAVIPKSIGPPGEWHEHPRRGRMKLVRYQDRPIGMVNIELYSTLPTDAWLRRELGVAREGGAPIIASVVANPVPGETTRLVRAVTETLLVDMIELNVSCPMPASTVGLHMGRDPKTIMEQTNAAKDGTDLPVMVKLTPVVSDIGDMAKAAVRGGADAIAATNSYRSLAGVDVETGRPYLEAFGGYTGPAVKPIILRCVADVARTVNVPISAIGGVSTWRDAVEYLMIGARTVQVCTAVMWNGVGLFEELCEGLTEFMSRKGYKRMDDFVGVALKHLRTVEDLARLPPMRAEVDQGRCNGCRKCETVCSFDAIRVVDRVAQADPAKCDGCGLCSEWCSGEAIQLVEKRLS